MSQMKELYEKVAADSVLQVRFTEILKAASRDGEDATKEKFIAFAKEAGYSITIEEMEEFFKELAESNDWELSDAELDQVSGGKSQGWIISLIGFFGLACAIVSAGMELIDGAGGCKKTLETPYEY